MSTRAIIALPTEQGYITAWCWNDGGPDRLGRELKQYFTEESLVRELLKAHSFSILDDPHTVYQYMRDGDTAVWFRNDRCALLHPHHGNVVVGMGEDGFFKDIDTMLDQDLNFVYVFTDGGWDTYC